ncbi:four helix bundle protein [Mucilaginibacter paludis]|uniref:Uncharacterized protein n=1 Tax=Mucilaginibacter paludis DSM 18603 TaxID=714943 RepID=H1YAV9_9SPHI|nr:hypothetical protein [Mucilaginibacter paludis]EHQ29568.1 hypothetical protein Mucpa_5496 [Mucilaginibacter paludis DSM 18603]
MAFRFKVLHVWQKTLGLADEINKLTKSFPIDNLKVIAPPIMLVANATVPGEAKGLNGQTKAGLEQFLRTCAQIGNRS